MKTRFLLLIFAISFFATEVKAQLPVTLEQHFQDTLDHMRSLYHFKGLTAAVSYKNAGTWKGAAGDSYDGTPMATDMLVGIGSNTKTFVSTIMLKLYEDGLVDLSDTIGTWLQGYANINGAITIKQVLNHTSGIFSYTEHPDFADSVNTNPSKVWTKEEILHDFVQAPDFAPGTNWNYSNTNFIIAGIIEEAVTGRQVYQLIRDSILTPNQLNETFFPPYETATLPYAHFWTNIGNGYLEDWAMPLELYSIANSAGGMVSTASDNTKFWQALFNGDIIKKSTLNDEMLHYVSITPSIGYGLGIFKEVMLGHVIFDHGGTWIGQINSNLMDTTRGIAITVLSNQDSLENDYTEKVVAALYKVALTQQSTAVNTVNANAIDYTFYPNPAKDFLYLSTTDNKTKTVIVSAMDGRVIFNQQFNAGQPVSVSLQNISSGIYAVTVMNEKSFVVNKQKIEVIR